MLANNINLTPTSWDTFLTFGEVNFSTTSITTINQLDLFFQEEISVFFKPSCFQSLYPGYGSSLMAKINRDFIMLSNLNKILMLKQLMMALKID